MRSDRIGAGKPVFGSRLPIVGHLFATDAALAFDEAPLLPEMLNVSQLSFSFE